MFIVICTNLGKQFRPMQNINDYKTNDISNEREDNVSNEKGNNISNDCINLARRLIPNKIKWEEEKGSSYGTGPFCKLTSKFNDGTYFTLLDYNSFKNFGIFSTRGSAKENARLLYRTGENKGQNINKYYIDQELLIAYEKKNIVDSEGVILGNNFFVILIHMQGEFNEVYKEVESRKFECLDIYFNTSTSKIVGCNIEVPSDLKV